MPFTVSVLRMYVKHSREEEREGGREGGRDTHL